MASDQNELKLYSNWRSSCSFRVRIALNLKGLKYEYKAVNVDKGEQFSPEFTKLNPIGYVPVLVHGDMVLADSFAIIMYLEDKYPHHHPLLPKDIHKKAINYQVASIVSSSIQPYQNITTLKSIGEKLGPDAQLAWAKHHVQNGLIALERLLKDHAGRFATGDEIFLVWFPASSVSLPADLFLAPQIYIAITMFNVDMTQFPILSRLHEAYNEIPAFQDAMPEKQPDTPLTRLKYEYKAVNLVKGEQFSPEFTKLNPIGYVPVLVHGDMVLADSFAIIMTSILTTIPLLPKDIHKKAINYQAASIVSSSIQPHQNLATLKSIGEKLGPDAQLAWAKHHVEKGCIALESLLKDHAGRFATGDEIFLVWFPASSLSLPADLFLAPQIHAAFTRFNVDKTQFPILSRLYETYDEIPAFQDAMPEKQPDAPLTSTS
uniref:glutathione transferase n=1 Tax=Fagus sylvatica TaxID=28930 RepID=A0A2N9EXD8_FAGSY